MQTESYFCKKFIIISIEENDKLKLIDGDRQGTILTAFFKKITDELNKKTL